MCHEGRGSGLSRRRADVTGMFRRRCTPGRNQGGWVLSVSGEVALFIFNETPAYIS